MTQSLLRALALLGGLGLPTALEAAGLRRVVELVVGETLLVHLRTRLVQLGLGALALGLGLGHPRPLGPVLGQFAMALSGASTALVELALLGPCTHARHDEGKNRDQDHRNDHDCNDRSSVHLSPPVGNLLAFAATRTPITPNTGLMQLSAIV